MAKKDIVEKTENPSLLDRLGVEEVSEVPERSRGAWDEQKLEQIVSELKDVLKDGKVIRIPAVVLWNELRGEDRNSLNYNQKYSLKRLFERRGFKSAIRMPYLVLWLEPS